MMRELGFEPSAAGVAARYGDLLDGYVVDHADADGVGNIEARVTIAKTLMASLHDRETLARVTLDAADALASKR
jgi:LPPG:FO 2-phospho-L-lactate transferase